MAARCWAVSSSAMLLVEPLVCAPAGRTLASADRRAPNANADFMTILAPGGETAKAMRGSRFGFFKNRYVEGGPHTERRSGTRNQAAENPPVRRAPINRP